MIIIVFGPSFRFVATLVDDARCGSNNVVSCSPALLFEEKKTFFIANSKQILQSSKNKCSARVTVTLSNTSFENIMNSYTACRGYTQWKATTATAINERTSSLINMYGLCVQ